jgi:uncharacterized protein (TIGR02246 family)
MIALLASLALLAAASPPAPTAAAAAQAHKAEAQKAIDTGNAAYIATWQRGDAHGFAQLFTENAASIADDGTITRGRATIEASRAEQFAAFALLKGTITTEDLVVEDDTAYEMGSYSFTIKPKNKASLVLAGRYLTIWQRQPDGHWLIKTDSGLSDRTCTKAAT